MTRLYSLLISILVLAPGAYATLAQASQMFA
jgi:hypothetical protein